MSDGRELAREFLEQQRLLGGDTVILPDAAPPPAVGRSGSQADEKTDRPTARLPDSPKRELPPPGISFDPPGSDLFSNDPVQRAGSLNAIAELVASCVKCRLCEGRAHTVPGEGPADARVVVVGEGPGRVEDETGRPFVGPAGELLTKILAAIELPRERVFICNVVKCRPPENRAPQYDEIAACVPYLFRQLDLLKPTVILAMGGTAAQTLLNTKQSLGALRNQIHRFRGIPVIVTYHPAALLRNPNWKKPTWDDVRIARRLLA
ncbi:MAG TPA: uracil-DNA glycosylase [Gemmatimonadales bacterium]|nr:uracil-DNA glycosylase [Gemmatimonadales bacterium]